MSDAKRRLWGVVPRSRTGRWLGGTVVVLLLALAAAWLSLPWMVRSFGIAGLERAGATRAEIAEAAVDLLEGRIALSGVVAQGDQPPSSLQRLLVQIDWPDLWSRRAHLRRAEFSGLDLNLGLAPDGSLSLSGIPLPLAGGAGAAAGGWGYGVDSLVIEDSQLRLAGLAVPVVVEVERLHLDSLLSWSPESPASVKLTGRVNGSAVDLSGQVRPFAEGRESRLKVTVAAFPLSSAMEFLPPDASVQTLSGRIDLELEATLGTKAGGLVVSDAGGRIVWPAGGELAMEGRRGDFSRGRAVIRGLNASLAEGSLAADLEVEAENVDSEAGPLSARARRLAWEGTLTASGRAEGQVAVDGLVARDVEAGIRLLADRLFVSGGATLAKAESSWPLAGRLRLEASQLALGGTGDDRDWLRIDQLAVADLRAGTAEGLLAQGGTITGLRALPLPDEGRWLVTAEAVKLTDLASPTPERLRIGEAELLGLEGRLQVTEAGIAGVPEEAVGPAEAEKQGAGLPVEVSVGVLSVGDGRLQFDDPTMEPAVTLVLEGLALRLQEVDTARPAADSPLSLKTRVGQFGTLTADGTLRPLALADRADVSLRLDGMDVVPLAGYLKEFTGAQPRSGNLSLDVSAQVSDGRLDSQNRVVLQALEFVPPDPGAPRRVNGVPLESGLELLRDDRGTIELALPVTGDVLAPEFDLSDAVGQAVGTVFKGAVTTTLKVLFPPAAIGSWVLSSLESAELQVPPLAFAPGNGRLDQEAMGYLEKVAALMVQHPKVTVRLCGLAVEQDAEALTEAARQAHAAVQAERKPKQREPFTPPAAAELAPSLKDLARRRSESAKGLLVGRFGLDQSRIAVCSPRIDSRPAAAPRVEVSL